MTIVRRWISGRAWLREAARQEFLRDPNVMLFERRPDHGPVQDGAGR